MPRSIGISELKRHQAIAWHSVCVCLCFYISKKPIFRTPLPSTISWLSLKWGWWGSFPTDPASRRRVTLALFQHLGSLFIDFSCFSQSPSVLSLSVSQPHCMTTRLSSFRPGLSSLWTLSGLGGCQSKWLSPGVIRKTACGTKCTLYQGVGEVRKQPILTQK